MDLGIRIDEQQLLRQVSDGDEAAFRVLFDQYRGKLFTYILKLSDSREMAEDTVHDVFLKIWEGRETLNTVENLNAYLFRIAHNQACNGFRRMAKETLIMAELQKCAVDQADFDSENRVIQKEISEIIARFVNRLTPQQRIVFLLSREEGLKQEEIACKLNISINTVKNHMVEALKFLRKELGQNYALQIILAFLIKVLSVV